MSALDDLSKNLHGIAAHRRIPEGETIGASFTFEGESWFVTQAEVDRVKNPPSSEEITSMVAAVNRLGGWNRG